MRFSKLFAPTLRESPADAEVVSHKLMLRAGMIRKVAAGIYTLLPLGVNVLKSVENIVREEMMLAGAQEVTMPMVVPSELWKESGRWDEYGKELLRLNDRHGRDFCLGPTHEEVVTNLVAGEVRSYKNLPMNLFQIQTKFRDEIRPRFGLMRGREFVMKDAYSFHVTEECAEKEYLNMKAAYSRIFERCGLDFRAVEADTGNIGGNFSHEFMVLADTGEDAIVSCEKCDYAANVERAEIGLPAGEGASSSEAASSLPLPEKVSTPGKKSIDEVSEFLKVKPETLIKSLVYNTDKGPVMALVRGDLEINNIKVKRAASASWAELASEDIVSEITGAPSGYVGPVGLKGKLIADFSVRSMRGAVTGANEEGAHLRNVEPGRDFSAEYTDLRVAGSGDKCPRCDEGSFKLFRGIEVGHIFMLGTKYSESMGAKFLDENGKEKPMIMGCYGIGIGRTAAAAIEQNHDEAGIRWPVPIAPYQVCIAAVTMKDHDSLELAESLYFGLMDKGIPTLMDDRNERAGVKFKDLDLIGIPVRITVSTNTMKEESVEIKERGGETRLVGYKDTVAEIIRILKIPPSG